jgi:hypothetical protein
MQADTLRNIIHAKHIQKIIRNENIYIPTIINLTINKNNYIIERWISQYDHSKNNMADTRTYVYIYNIYTYIVYL